MREFSLSDQLLNWYDHNARDMPWRIGPQDRKRGVTPDPYRVWMSEIMLQQTTVAAVTAYFLRFTARWPDVTALASAEDEEVMAEWAGLGYYARARNLLKCARSIVDHHGGAFPNEHNALLALPGIGPYTAAAISSIAFDRRHTVVDGNVERVMSRLHDIHMPLPSSKPLLTEKAEALTPLERCGDYAQAVMDLGATVCTPKSPACGLCPWSQSCKARQAGTAQDLPKKTPKKEKPTRKGYAYVVRDSLGAYFLEKRPDKGLLGGMMGWPTSDWSDAPTDTPPMEGDWRELKEEVLHTFTHFHLRLQVKVLMLKASQDTLHFVSTDKFKPSGLPTVMRKVFDLAHSDVMFTQDVK